MQLNTILTTITPSMFAAAYAEPESTHEVAGVVYCNFMNVGTMRIHADGFVAVDLASSRMKGGSVVDVLAAMLGGPAKDAYFSAIASLCRSFRQVLPAGSDNDADMDALAVVAMVKRRLYNAIVCNSSGVDALPGALAASVGVELNNAVNAGCISYLDADKMDILKDRLSRVGIDADLTLAPAVIVPYFSHTYEVACIDIIYATGSGAAPVKTLWLTKHKLGIACLLMACENNEFFLEAVTGDALRDICDVDEARSSHIAIRVRPDSDMIGWTPKRFCFVDRGNPSALVVPASLVRHGSACIVTKAPSIQGTKALGSVTWGEAIAQCVIGLLEEAREFTPLIMHLLDTVRADSSVKVLVRNYLMDKGDFWLSSRLDIILRTGIIWEGAGWSLFTTLSGYVYSDRENMDTGGDLVTNFTIIPLYSVRYEGGNIYYACEVDVRGEQRVVILGSACFDTIKKLAEGIQKYIALSGAATEVIPTVFDTSHCRALIPHLQKLFSELPIREGITTLGWNGTRTAFVGPDFRCAEQIVYAQCIFKPEVAYLAYFNSSETMREASPILKGLPEQLMTIIKQCAGIIARSYSNHPVTAVSYLNTETARATLGSLFSYVGQTSILQLNQNMRSASALSCFQGYPFAAIGYNRKQAKTVTTGMILLGEEGPTLRTYSNTTLASAGRVLRLVMEKLPFKLICNCGLSYTPEVGAIGADELAVEGWTAMQEIL